MDTIFLKLKFNFFHNIFFISYVFFVIFYGVFVFGFFTTLMYRLGDN